MCAESCGESGDEGDVVQTTSSGDLPPTSFQVHVHVGGLLCFKAQQRDIQSQTQLQEGVGAKMSLGILQ